MQSWTSARLVFDVLAASLACGYATTAWPHIVATQVRPLAMIACLVHIAALFQGLLARRRCRSHATMVIAARVAWKLVRKAAAREHRRIKAIIVGIGGIEIIRT